MLNALKLFSSSFLLVSCLTCIATLFRLLFNKLLEELEDDEDENEVLPDNSITIQKIRYKYEENKRFFILSFVVITIAFILSLF